MDRNCRLRCLEDAHCAFYRDVAHGLLNERLVLLTKRVRTHSPLLMLSLNILPAKDTAKSVLMCDEQHQYFPAALAVWQCGGRSQARLS